MSKKKRNTRGRKAIDVEKLKNINDNLDKKLAPTSDTEIFGSSEDVDMPIEPTTTPAEEETNIVDEAIRNIQSGDDVLDQLKKKFGDRTKDDKPVSSNGVKNTESAESTEATPVVSDTDTIASEDTCIYLRKEYDACASFADLAAFARILKNAVDVDITTDLGGRIVATFITAFERLDASAKLHINLLERFRKDGLKHIVVCNVMSQNVKNTDTASKYKAVLYKDANDALEVLKCWVK